MAGVIAGTVFLKVNGSSVFVRGNVRVSLSSGSKEELVGLDGLHGFKDTPEAPYIECDVSDTSSLDVIALNNASNVTVTAELANGKTAVLAGAYQTNKLEVDADEGQATVRFVGSIGRYV